MHRIFLGFIIFKLHILSTNIHIILVDKTISTNIVLLVDIIPVFWNWVIIVYYERLTFCAVPIIHGKLFLLNPLNVL